MFRIAVGLIMVLESISFFLPSESSAGRSHLEVYYSSAPGSLHFPYEAFSWLPMLPSPWIQSVCALMGLAAFGLALGLCYRLCSVVTFLCWGYLYAVECTRTYWMSYFYLELLALFLLLFMPAGARFSLDALRNRKPSADSSIPFWPLFILRAQLIVTYFYAGLAKINHDWLFNGVPVRIFLEKPWVAARLKSLLPSSMADSVNQMVHSPLLIHFLGWSGAIFDLTVGFLLIFKRTRLLGWVLMLIFHSINHFILFTDIGWFPLLGVTTATIFLAPDWPIRVRRWLSSPHLPKPDWPWLVGGATALPVVGAALGWRSRPTPNAHSWMPHRLSTLTPALVLLYVVFQILFPLRGELIPGDSRFTFEGLSWSWRLKAEVYRCAPSVISLSAPSFVTPATGSDPAVFQWDRWPKDRQLFRLVKPDRLDWATLPEIIVIFEPRTGDRILYNVQSASVSNRAEEAIRSRIANVWNELYGRKPTLVGPTAPLSRVLEGYERAMRKRGQQFNNSAEVLRSFNSVDENTEEGKSRMSVLRRIEPFAWSTTRPTPGTFFLIEDNQLMRVPPAKPPRLDPSQWRNHFATLGYSTTSKAQVTPLIVHHSELGEDERQFLPQVYVADSLEDRTRPPEARWNLFRDVSMSKGMHLSMQPFLLRRYSRRVADLWMKEQGYRPAVHARTSVSLNRHPPQPVVDPAADLASVEATWFGHNPWILDFKPGTPASTSPDSGECRANASKVQ